MFLQWMKNDFRWINLNIKLQIGKLSWLDTHKYKNISNESLYMAADGLA